MQISLSGHHAVITGGGSGIGLAIARLCISANAKVTILDRNIEKRDIATDIGADFKQLDVSDEVMVEDAANDLESGKIAPDILITSAGILQSTLPPQELSWDEWDRTVKVHQRGTFACCKSFGSRMAVRGSGSIVTLSSVAGLESAPLHVYGPSKAAIAHLSKCLAAEWGGSGIRVNSVAPGFTATPALEKGLAGGFLDEERLQQATALGRLVDPEEVAKAILFLVSDMASAITGIILPVDAGYLVSGGWAAYGGLRQNHPK